MRLSLISLISPRALFVIVVLVRRPGGAVISHVQAYKYCECGNCKPARIDDLELPAGVSEGEDQVTCCRRSLLRKTDS